MAGARCPVRRGPAAGHAGWKTLMPPATPCCSPSTWEGFGNPSVESATHRRPLAVGPYPVSRELRAFGFLWFDADDPGALAGFLASPDQSLLAHNHTVAATHFDQADLPGRLATVLEGLGVPGP